MSHEPEVHQTKEKVHIYLMLALQCMHDNLLKSHSFCWALHTKWYPSVRIDKKIQVKYDLGRRLYGGQGENKIGGAHLRHVGSAIYA